MIKALVYLGNAGKEYSKTRHNAGFIMAEELYKNEKFQIKFHSQFLKKDDYIVLKPVTYMNNSGIAVAEAKAFFKFKPDEILVIHDDLRVPLGEARLEKGGPLFAHNGLRSINDRIGSSDFYRLRLGIGQSKFNNNALYVTSNFTTDELISLYAIIDKCKSIDYKNLKLGVFTIN